MKFIFGKGLSKREGELGVLIIFANTEKNHEFFDAVKLFEEINLF